MIPLSWKFCSCYEYLDPCSKLLPKGEYFPVLSLWEIFHRTLPREGSRKYLSKNHTGIYNSTLAFELGKAVLVFESKLGLKRNIGRVVYQYIINEIVYWNLILLILPSWTSIIPTTQNIPYLPQGVYSKI